jgi:hypothetical protein
LIVEVQHDLGRHFKSLRFRIVLVFDAFFGRAICRAAPLRAAHLQSAIISGGASAIKTRGEVLEFSCPC